jgi:dolichol-phosphate mannosyltransferase
MSGAKCQLIFSNNQPKSGRGASVRRGILSAVKLFPNLQFIVECDADGSHRPVDIIKLIQSRNNADLLIGSRYMRESKIIGWPLSRVFFSLVLNYIIPKLIGVQVKDVTNGLRRYSKQAIELIVSEVPRTSGFIYLTEILVLVKNKKLSISELPTTFVNRVIGKSTVTFNEILSATFGLVLILKKDS